MTYFGIVNCGDAKCNHEIIPRENNDDVYGAIDRKISDLQDSKGESAKMTNAEMLIWASRTDRNWSCYKPFLFRLVENVNRNGDADLWLK